MATTVTAPVNNSIALAQSFLPILDEIYRASSKSSILDTANDRVRFTGAQTVNLFTTDINGLSDYSRNAGFVPGAITGAWEAFTISQDRGRSWMVDVMDNDETVGMAFGTLVGEAERTQIIPEIDSYRFAKYGAGAGTKATPTTIIASTDIAGMIDAAEAAMTDAEVPMEGRILFVSPTAYKQLKGNITRFIQNDQSNVNYAIEMYNTMRVIQVPAARFNTGITLNAPTSSSGAGGYTLAGVPINFMIIHPSAVLQVVKHIVPRIFSPEVNQEADAWKFDYRIVHDCWVETNKTKGIYLAASAPTTAMTLSASTSTISGTGTDTVTVSNGLGVVTVASADEAVCTASITGTTVTITGVAAGTANVVVTDGIGQTATVAVTVS